MLAEPGRRSGAIGACEDCSTLAGAGECEYWRGPGRNVPFSGPGQNEALDTNRPFPWIQSHHRRSGWTRLKENPSAAR
jgi:hypothetical protein